MQQTASSESDAAPGQDIFPGPDTSEPKTNVGPDAGVGRDRGWCGRVGVWAGHVSVEPVLFMHNMCSQVSYLSSQDLMVEKACKVNFGLSDEVCRKLKDYDSSQVAVQDLVSTFLMYRSIFETAIQVVWVLVLGSWSDRWGRRVPLIFSITCLLGESAVYLVCALSPRWSMETTLLGSVMYSLSGGTHGLLMLCFAHLADTSHPRSRTLRMGFLDASYYLGAPVGNALVGVLLDTGSYMAAFPFVIVVYIVSIMYIAARVRRPERSSARDNETSGCVTMAGEAGRLCVTACDAGQLYEAVKVTIRPRPQRATIHILLLILAMLCDSLPVWGESNVKYLFVQRVLRWGHTQYSHWGTFSSLFSVCVMVVVVPLLSMVMAVADGWIGVMGGVSKICGSVLYGLVTSPSLAWLMWTGKVYAVMATLESLLPFLAAPLYNVVYTATNTTRAATYNYLSAGFHVCLTLLLLGVTMSMTKVTQILP
ncbi:proton-coupled folate transporter isoform X2 [Cherax quadricarinatus]|uniref:proton-coupled folate transporter isoform X2 n=1 Tax=Cherax quadricarinatus TaxID=27406 RepID=UPI00387ECCB6